MTSNPESDPQTTPRALVLGLAMIVTVSPAISGLGTSAAADTEPRLDETAPAAAALPYDGLVPAIEDRFAGQADVSFDEAIELGQLVGQHQASTLSADLALEQPVPEHASPSDAAIALAKLHGAELSADQREELQALDILDEPLRTELTDTIDAFLAFYLAADSAYGSSTPLGDHGDVFAARNLLLDAVADLHAALDAPGSSTTSSQTTVAPFLAVDLDGLDSTYTEDIVLVIDAGGNDTYHNNAGGNHRAFSPAAALVDLGNGADGYGNPDNLRLSGVNGGGAEGAGFLVDAGGNDTYHASYTGVNGGGWRGSGFLLDHAGNDTSGTLDDDGNLVTSWGANGGGGGAFGAGGAGTLVDVAGDDDYRAYNRGVNGGGNDASSGLLVDLAGDDNYTANAAGTNGGVGMTSKYSLPVYSNSVPDVPVSQGLLFDANGTDRYEDDHIERETPDGIREVYDKTYVPKGHGIGGAQMDSDDPPGGDPS